AVFRLTEDRPPGIHLLPRPAASECAPELRRKPRPRRVDLAGRKVCFSLVQRDVLPVRPNRRHAGVWTAEGGFEKDGIVRKQGTTSIGVALRTALAECVDQASKC